MNRNFSATSALTVAALLAGCSHSVPAGPSQVESISTTRPYARVATDADKLQAKYPYRTTADVYIVSSVDACLLAGVDASEHPLGSRAVYDRDMRALAATEPVGMIRANETVHSVTAEPSDNVLIVVTDDGKFGVLCPNDGDRVLKSST